MINNNEYKRIVDDYLEICSENDLFFGGMNLSKAQFKQRFLLFLSQYERNPKICYCELPREKYEERFEEPSYLTGMHLSKAERIRRERRKNGYYKNARHMSKDKPLDPNDPKDFILGHSLDLF
ncbi:hypothetical protein EVU91_13660 [Macrococcoides bohemicum]|uniref:hypothetical protein n=1 Tax=Macrococcoides bohemicum TaxID=1903056 RepID=UPI00105A1E41|nr:hypothetical protein [Macrococcus bohemicus]QYA46159.1 hypothetical protein KYI13_12990 [Macrococcus bohemicus]TDL32353.1 hypothetical protein EVU91_13660 [Macrococcus bohemicus]